MSTSSPLNDKDLKTIDHYVQHLVYKSVQSVVQSRRGVKVHTQSQAVAAAWFNLQLLEDLSNVQDELKAKLSKGRGHAACLAEPVCVEVVLRTSDGDVMTLEYWWILLKVDASVTYAKNEVTPGVLYKNSESFLKSLLTISRATPSYRLSRRQSAENYTVTCHISLGEPRISAGDKFKTGIVGKLPTPHGTVILNLAYQRQPHLGARCVGVPVPSLGKNVSSTVDVPLEITDNYYDAVVPSSDPQIAEALTKKSDDLKTKLTIRDPSDWLKPKRAAFGPSLAKTVEQSEESDSDIPFASLLQQSAHTPRDERKNRPAATNEAKDDVESKLDGSSSENDILRKDGSQSVMIRDDFVMLELRAPFAGTEEDLGRFYLECQSAPALSMFDELRGKDYFAGGGLSAAAAGGGSMSSITAQLAQFEASASDFNDFINSLQEVDS